MRHLVNYNILVVLKQFVEKTDQTRAEWSRYLSIIFVSVYYLLLAADSTNNTERDSHSWPYLYLHLRLYNKKFPINLKVNSQQIVS